MPPVPPLTPPNLLRTSFVVLTSTLALVVGCGDGSAQADPAKDKTTTRPATTRGWPLYRATAGLTGVAPGKLGNKFELAWSFETKDAILSSPVIVDGVVYFGSSDQSVYAVNIKTGKKVWSFPTDDVVDAPALILDGKVYIGSGDSFFYALDAKTGKELWKFETGDKIVGGANYARVKDGSIRILVGSHDYKLYCFDTAGKKQWEYATDNYVNGTPAILGGNTVFGGCDSILHVVSVETGKKVAGIPLGTECYVANSVAMADGTVYLGHYGNEVLAVTLETGEVLWGYPSRKAFFSSPAIGKDRIVVGGRDKKLHCLARKDGKPIWTFPTKRKIDGSPVICGDKVVVGSGDGRLYVLRLSDGKEVWKYEIGRPVFSSPAVVDGMIFVGANDGRLYAFRPK